MFDSRLGAWYSDDSALSQRRIIARRLVCARSDTCSLCRSKAPLLQELRSVVAFSTSSKTRRPFLSSFSAVLVIFSIVSWGIILYKLWTFNRIQAQSSRFLEIFRRSTKFSEVQAVCQSLNDSPLVGIFLAGYAELNLQLRQAGGGANPATPAAAPRARAQSLVSVDRALMRASNVETNKLEKHITFLATTAAVTPFIGLFGTVLGIIAAFQGIGAQGSTSLDVVAPGIADALIATAAGLAAAIPAVYFYNLLSQRVKALASDMDDFSLEFLNIVERNFT